MEYHQAEYSGTRNGYHEFRCPLCGWRKAFPVDGSSMPVTLNYGDINAGHQGATIAKLRFKDVGVEVHDPRLDVFDEFMDKLTG